MRYAYRERYGMPGGGGCGETWTMCSMPGEWTRNQFQTTFCGRWVEIWTSIPALAALIKNSKAEGRGVPISFPCLYSASPTCSDDQANPGQVPKGPRTQFMVSQCSCRSIGDRKAPAPFF